MATWLQRLGFRLHPLFHPFAEEERRRMKELRDALKQQEKALTAQRDELTRLGARLQNVEETTNRAVARTDSVLTRSQRDLERWRDEMVRRQREGQAVVGGTLKAIRSHFSRRGTFTATVLQKARLIPEQRFREQAVLDRLARIAASGRPILAGPWAGEVGFELLYWAPFLRWVVGHFGIDPSRLTVVSRGGPESWYRGVAGAYVDLFQYVAPDRFVAETSDTLKQRRLSAFDAHLVRRIAQERGLKRVAILHPRYMYTLFHSFFARDGGIRHVFAHTVHRRIESPRRALIPGLPDDYVAVKFYFRRSFPRTPENIAFVRALLDEIARDHKIVLLDSGLKVDDHDGYRDERFYDLASLGVSVTPENNLEMQTAVVAAARAFVGTYGGFCYLAPLCGVPAVAFYGNQVFYLYHRYMADVVFASLNVPPLAMLPTDAARLQRRAVLDLLAAPVRQS